MEYHKIQTVYKRNPETNHKTLLEGEFSLPEFEYLARNQWIFTEKVDGTNIRVIISEDSIRFGGRTDNAQIPSKLLARLQERFLGEMQERMFDHFPDGAILYGEGYGAGIQKVGKLYRETQDFVLFDVKVGNWWLSRSDVVDVAQQLELNVVPIIGAGTLYDMVELARSGFVSAWGDFTAEGIVARPRVELKTRSGHRLITKIKYSDFPK